MSNNDLKDIYIEFEPTPIQQSRILKYCEKVKEALFITEDGVEIFTNQLFYHVDSNWSINTGKTTDNFIKLKGYKEFSTKKAAEDWIINNKPCLSINDIINSNISIDVNNYNYYKNELIKLTKSKLNK